MKTFLEALVDDKGHLTLHTDFDFYDDVKNRPPSLSAIKKENDKYNRMLIEGVVPALWRDHNYQVSKAIRYLSMAEVISCIEPYDNAEQLWYSLMTGYIPHYEKFADKLKIPYGYDPSKIIRPKVFDGSTIMQMSKDFIADSFPPSVFPGIGKGGRYS